MHEERYEESAKLNWAGLPHRPNRRQRAPMRQWVDSAILLTISDIAARGAFSWRAGVLQLQKYMNSEFFAGAPPDATICITLRKICRALKGAWQVHLAVRKK